MTKSRWWEDEDSLEQIDKVQKMRKGGKKGKSSKNAHLEDSFITLRSDIAANLKANKTFFIARVVEVHKKFCFVSPDNNKGKTKTSDVWLATIAKKYLQADRTERNFVAVGDLVICRPDNGELGNPSDDLPQCIVENRLERLNKIARRDPLNEEMTHVLACNLDQLVIVASALDPKLKWGLIDRYLTLAETENLESVIIITKKDLLESPDMKEYKEQILSYMKIYQSLGYKVLLVQSNQSEDENPKQAREIRAVLKDKVSLLSGHSGVGKSSIVNLMDPEIEQDVEDVDIFYKGRHTTTYASYIRLSKGGYVVDTPGIRSFCIDERTPPELQYCFRELRPLIGKCKYRECRHIDEPQCAVKEAVENGSVKDWRYRSFLSILLGATGREGRLRDIHFDLEER